jgi:hypothetical protein
MYVPDGYLLAFKCGTLQPGLPKSTINATTSEMSIGHGKKARTAQRTTAKIINLTSGNLLIVRRNAVIKRGLEKKNYIYMCVCVGVCV